MYFLIIFGWLLVYLHLHNYANTLLKIPGNDHVHYHHFNFMAPVY